MHHDIQHAARRCEVVTDAGYRALTKGVGARGVETLFGFGLCISAFPCGGKLAKTAMRVLPTALEVIVGSGAPSMMRQLLPD